MAPKPPLDPTQLKLLRDDLDLVHLLFHRNKNQHRILRWWQWIGTLKRNLTKLLAEHDLITAAKSTPARNAALEMYRARVAFMRKVVVPTAYTAFGTVIAMKNFAPLGMVLTGVLARVWKMIKPSEEELAAERAAEVALSAEAETEMEMDAELGVVISREGYGIEDAGEVISRAEYELATAKPDKKSTGKRVRSMDERGEADPSGSAKAARDSGSPAKAKKPKAPAVEPETKRKKKTEAEGDKKKKKKKKKSDDIDDLFSGLF